jgi:nicotinate-nucleotide pyrophosphorylase (carboxylating)
MALSEQKEVQRLIQLALKEDLGAGDVTTQTISTSLKKIQAVITVQEPAIVAGSEVAVSVFRMLDPKTQVRILVQEGKKVKAGEHILQLKGKASAILSGERVALNFLARLSGIATLTRQFVEKIRPLQTQILDTRKTTPGWRILEKYAVRIGGGNNHRQGLFDQILIKDNHLDILQKNRKWKRNRERFWDELFREIRTKNKKHRVIETEVHQFSDLPLVLANHPDWILVDNFTPAHVRKAVALRNQIAPDVLMEASGGITLDNARQYAQTGVDALAIGRLTHSATGINFSLEIA